MSDDQTNPNGAWCVLYGPPNHVVPNEDLVDHALSMTCWCVPVFIDGCVVHNSADGRESYERRHWSTYSLPQRQPN